jgi:hypothetical protein
MKYNINEYNSNRFFESNLIAFERVNGVIVDQTKHDKLLAWWVVCDDQDKIEDKNQLKTNK